MSNTYNFINSAVGGHELGGIVTGACVGGLLIAIGFVAVKNLKSATNPLLPDTSFSARNFIEVFLEGIVQLGDMVMGRDNRKYIPFVASLFLFLFLSNLVGLVPGFVMPTDNVKFNLGIALLVFILYNFWGMKEVGFLGYLKHMWGPIWWVGPLLFPIEIISHVVRPFSLSLRLYGNMTGDHLAVSVFTDLTKAGIPVIFYLLGTFVCLIQAFVFTLLTMVYIRLAVVHEDSHSH